MHMLWCGIHFLQKVWTRSSIHKSHYQHEFVLWKKIYNIMHACCKYEAKQSTINSKYFWSRPSYLYHDHNFNCLIDCCILKYLQKVEKWKSNSTAEIVWPQSLLFFSLIHILKLMPFFQGQWKRRITLKTFFFNFA